METTDKLAEVEAVFRSNISMSPSQEVRERRAAIADMLQSIRKLVSGIGINHLVNDHAFIQFTIQKPFEFTQVALLARLTFILENLTAELATTVPIIMKLPHGVMIVHLTPQGRVFSDRFWEGASVEIGGTPPPTAPLSHL